MLTSVPFTWDEMRALGEPTMPLEACEICKQIPGYCRDEFPDAIRELESAGLLEEDKDQAWRRCPNCHRLYEWTYSPYEYLAWGSEDAHTTYTRVEARAVFGALTQHRIAHERFGRALAAIDPQLAIDKREIVEHAKDYYPHHRIVRIACRDRRLWIALSDDGDVIPCTLAELAKIAASAPPPDLDQSANAVEYAAVVDHVTSEHEYGEVIVDAFTQIPWRAELTAEDRAYIEVLRAASRVEPQHAEQLADHVVVRRWVVAHQKLIFRVLTVWPTGEVRREDAVIGEAIPTHPGKQWAYNVESRHNEPIG